MDLLRVRDVAQRLGVQEATIRRWIFMRKIPTVRVGRAVRVREKDVDALIQEGFTPALTNDLRPNSGGKQ